MENQNNNSEVMPQKSAEMFAGILREAVESYIQSMDTQPVNEWLNGYLTAQMPQKSTEEIAEITANIMDAVKKHDEKIASMKKAIESGQSAESWFARETMSSEKTVGEQAKELVECHSSLTEISNSYEEPENCEETIDVEVIPPEEWEDSNWNSYKIKDALLETAKQAGNVAIKNTASDLYSKITEYGFRSVLTDKTLIKDSVLYGANTGLKAATTGALEVAKDRCIIPELAPETNTGILANIAGIAIENVKVLGSIAKGDIGFSDGLAMIKNNTVATISGMFGQKYGVSIGAAVGSVVGPLGTMVGGFIGGAVGKFAGTKVGSAIVSTAKKVGSVAKSFCKKVGSAVKSAGSKILSFFRR